jgi:hypothetical protein
MAEEEEVKKPKVKPPPLMETDTQMIEFDEDTWGPEKYQAFEREGPMAPWHHLGSATSREGAEEILKTERMAPTTLVDRLRKNKP